MRWACGRKTSVQNRWFVWKPQLMNFSFFEQVNSYVEIIVLNFIEFVQCKCKDCVQCKDWWPGGDSITISAFRARRREDLPLDNMGGQKIDFTKKNISTLLDDHKRIAELRSEKKFERLPV